MLIGLIALSACSKEDNQAVKVENTSTEKAKSNTSIKLNKLYSIPLGSNGTLLISEFENDGTVGISAFKGTWTVVNDLDETVAALEVRFTSETHFTSGEDIKFTSEEDLKSSSHIISPGEKILIVHQSIQGKYSTEKKIFAGNEESIVKYALKVVTNLEPWRVVKKHYFAVEKIVPQ